MKKVDYEHFSRFLYPCNVQCRQDEIYFTMKRADFEDNDYKSDLFVLKDGVQKQLTASGKVSAYYLEQDGIYFPDIRNDKDKEAVKAGRPLTVIYKMDYDGGEAREVFRLDTTVLSINFLEADRFFFTGAFSHQLAAAMARAKGDMEAVMKEMTEEADYHVLDELPFWFNGMGFINKVRPRLFFYDKGAVRPITDEYTHVDNVVLSPDRKTLVYTARRYTDTASIYGKMFSMDTATFQQTDISVEPEMEYYHVGFLNNDEIIVGATDGKSYGLNQNPDIYRCDLKKHNLRKLYDQGAYCMGDSVNTDIMMGRGIAEPPMIIGNGYFYIDTVGADAHLVRLDVETGEIEAVTKERGAVREAVQQGEGFIAIAMRGMQGCELYAIDAQGNERQLSSFNTEVGKQYYVSSPIDLTFQNEEGVEIQGFVIPPVGAKAGVKYPTILDIHGGPKTAYGSCYFHEMQLWANMGYAVIFCNPTGGDGRGNAFADIRGKYGTIDFRDIMAFCDKCIAEHAFIDADRMGVTGGSYGGFMTNWIIGHTDRFKAAASQRSISNWTSFSMTSDIGPHFGNDQNNALMWDDLDKVWEQSPLKYADKVKTPTLFIHAEEDYRCPSSEGIQMFSALKYHGIPSRLVLFKGENHELSRSGKPKHRVRRLKEITEWFESYLK